MDEASPLPLGRTEGELSAVFVLDGQALALILVAVAVVALLIVLTVVLVRR